MFSEATEQLSSAQKSKVNTQKHCKKKVNSTMMLNTYRIVDHHWTLRSHSPNCLENIYHILHLHPLKTDTQSYKRSCSSHTVTVNMEVRCCVEQNWENYMGNKSEGVATPKSRRTLFRSFYKTFRVSFDEVFKMAQRYLHIIYCVKLNYI